MTHRIQTIKAQLCASLASPGGDLDVAPTSLTAEQVDQYWRDGFLVLRKLFSIPELNLYTKRFKDVCNNVTKVPASMLVMRDVALAQKMKGIARSDQDVSKLQDLQDDPVFFESFMNHSGMIQVVGELIGSNVRTIHSMCIQKVTDPGKQTTRHPMHQDLAYFPFDSADKILGTWVAVQSATRENGCLSVIPGSHRSLRGDERRGLLAHGYPPEFKTNNHAYHGILGQIDANERIHLEMNPGDCVFFHPLLVHGSGSNVTPEACRLAISTHYASGLCKFHEIPMNLLVDMLQSKFPGSILSRLEPKLLQAFYYEAWKEKSRQVSGYELPHWQPNEHVINSFMEKVLQYSECDA